MTAFAVRLEPRRLTVAGDTLAYVPDRHDARPLGFISKVIPLPQINAVLFSRGMYAVCVNAAAHLFLAPDIFSIEDAAERLPGILRQVTDSYAAQHEIEDHTALGMLELIIAGWSEQQQLMRLWYFANHDSYRPQEGTSMQGLNPFPRLPADFVPTLTGLADDDQLIAMVKGIGNAFADPALRMGGAHIGGEIVAYELTPGRMEMRTIYRFADYEQTRHAAAATVARIERGDLTVSVADGLVPIAGAADASGGKPTRAAPARTPAASVAPGLSRQQRRAAERLARKGRAA